MEMILRPLVHPALRVGCLTVSLASACASESRTSATLGEASDAGTAGTAETTESGSGTTGEMPPATSGTTDATGEPTTDGEAPTIPFTCSGGAIVPGMNSIDVGGASRTFLADFPADLDRPLGVLFSWHGYGDTAMNFRAAVGLDPDADPALPVVVITPEDSGLPPPMGLDWDIAGGAAPDNVDLALFEAVLGCLDAQYEVDATRIYSFGFSAGSVMTNLLHSSYPELLTTIVSASGAWFNDAAEAELVNIFDIDWNWPALDPAVGGTVLLTHGGPTDVTVPPSG
jgi:predicted esterase